jgi:hypothetical protein
MKHQRAAPLITWDYHVILLFYDNEWKIADLDSSMHIPCPVKEYLSNSFVSLLDNCAPPIFRVVAADHFVKYFASDRRHMRNQDGTFLKPPPPSAPIKPASGEEFNLWDFVDIENSKYGSIYDLKQMYTTFGK